jgi:hypothetical protein
MPDTELPVLGYGPNDIPRLTGGAISRSRVYRDLASGKLRAKKAGPRTIIPPEEIRRYIASLPDWEPNDAA